ncbi:hypothetical protein HDU92_002488 [Lobulomyces angularis]|nr:hypothetical protein HDU92_002488 [Lobulomyces angularis]
MSLLTGRGKYLSELEVFDKVKVESACKDIGSFVLNLKNASAQWDKDIRHFKDLRDQICHDPERSLNFTMSSSDFLVAVKDQGRITGYKRTGWSFEEYMDYVLDKSFLQIILGYTKESIVDEYYY